MSEHIANISWQKQGAFSHEGFERGHEALISGQTIPMAGANTPNYVDPEQMLAASLASCHMQTFLALAAKKRLQVESYEDTATAKVEKNDDGSFDIVVSSTKPETDRNWLPAPKSGTFSLTLRYYVPVEGMLNPSADIPLPTINSIN